MVTPKSNPEAIHAVHWAFANVNTVCFMLPILQDCRRRCGMKLDAGIQLYKKSSSLRFGGVAMNLQQMVLF